MSGLIGVAISTTGDEHRLGLLAQSIAMWRSALAEKNNWTSEGTHLFVTIDGDEAACKRVIDTVGYEPVQFYRVGQPWGAGPFGDPYEGRLGVAVNKNTGLELLMNVPVIEHLFLCDDDTWPLYAQSLDKHTGFEYRHSMVCWGKHRIDYTQASYAAWNWPRGVMLYQHRSVVERVGGMDERFGPGGHEHVEYSQRIHNAKVFTAEPFVTPASYATRGGMGAAALWHAEDMKRPGEPLGNFRMRKRELTSIRRTDEDWPKIDAIMSERQGSADFVSYRAADNGRASATLCPSTSSLGAEK